VEGTQSENGRSKFKCLFCTTTVPPAGCLRSAICRSTCEYPHPSPLPSMVSEAEERFRTRHRTAILRRTHSRQVESFTSRGVMKTSDSTFIFTAASSCCVPVAEMWTDVCDAALRYVVLLVAVVVFALPSVVAIESNGRSEFCLPRLRPFSQSYAVDPMFAIFLCMRDVLLSARLYLFSQTVLTICLWIRGNRVIGYRYL